MFGLPKQLNKARWFIYSVVVFFVLTELRDLLTLIVRPYNIQLLNLTEYNANSLNAPSWGLANFDLISFALTVIIVGFIATWQVRRYEKEIAQLKEDNLWLSDKYQIYEPIINKIKKPKTTKLSAHLNLQPTTPDEIRFGEIQERLKKN